MKTLNLLSFQFLLNYYFQVCSIFFIIWIGALTSKPFAYKVRPWELTSSFIVDLTTIYAEWIWVDLKNLDIMWILPWINTTSKISWISDKTWFSYDGFFLNRLTKFFIWRKHIFFPLIVVFHFFTDPLFTKYFTKYLYISNLKKTSLFTTSKDYLFSFLFIFYRFSLNFGMQHDSYSKDFIKFNINNNYNIFYEKNLKKRFFNNNFLFRKPAVTCMWFFNNFICFWWKFLRKKNVFFLKKFNTFCPISSNLLLVNILLNWFFTYSKNLFYFLPISADSLTLSFLVNFKTININSKKAQISQCWIIFPFDNKKFYFNKICFNLLKTIEFLNFFNLFFLIHSNIWLFNPNLHIFLWTLVKKKNLLIVTIGNSDELLFKSINLGFTSMKVKWLFLGMHWVSSFIHKIMKIGFMLDKENSYHFNNFIYLFKNRKINFLSIKKILNLKRFFFSNASVFFYYSGEYALLNFFSSLRFKSLNYYFNKNLYVRQNAQNSLYISSFTNLLPSLFVLEFFSKNIVSLKKNIFILLESNIQSSNLSTFWDLICPTNILTENFFLYKNYNGAAAKSLFLRFGVWYSWNNLNFLKGFILLKNFPFFWYSNTKVFFSNVISFFFHLWIINVFSSSFTFSLKHLFFKKINVFSENFLVPTLLNSKFFLLNFVNWNFWFSRLSFINSSKYSKLGYALLKKEKMTFLQTITLKYDIT